NETTLYCPLQQDANDCSSLARYDAEGRLAWVRDLGVTKNGHWYAQTVAGGSVAVIGYFRALTDPELNGADLSIDDDEIGVLVAQYDIEDGHFEWARPVKVDEPEYREGIGITALPEGGFLAHFKFGSSLAFEGDDPGQRDLVAGGEEDVALVRFSATGEILWMHGMGGTEREMVYGGAQMDGMSIWLTGAYGSDPFIATSGHGDDIELPLTDSIWDDTSDIFLMRFDKVGPPTE
ncbi:MAG: hypothetical protein M0R80_29170, partial [Proteobacteria bacterium]|nr:hypothetical protein [Pseudomonadota bacterium]